MGKKKSLKQQHQLGMFPIFLKKLKFGSGLVLA
jgi:hypothetical protein